MHPVKSAATGLALIVTSLGIAYNGINYNSYERELIRNAYADIGIAETRIMLGNQNPAIVLNGISSQLQPVSNVTEIADFIDETEALSREIEKNPSAYATAPTVQNAIYSHIKEKLGMLSYRNNPLIGIYLIASLMGSLVSLSFLISAYYGAKRQK